MIGCHQPYKIQRDICNYEHTQISEDCAQSVYLVFFK
jgi:hypothetical protein